MIELAKPTTVSAGLPGRLVAVKVLPSTGPPLPGPPPPGAGFPARTTWPGPSAQCPAFSTTSSTGPPGSERPTRVVCPQGWPWNSSGIVVSSNGPAIAVTPATCAVAASCAAVARPGFAVTVTSAPCCAANALVNGELLALSSARPRVAEAVAMNSTATITTACTLCRSIPPDAVRTTLSQLPAPGRSCPWPPPAPLVPSPPAWRA